MIFIQIFSKNVEIEDKVKNRQHWVGTNRIERESVMHNNGGHIQRKIHEVLECEPIIWNALGLSEVIHQSVYEQ